jgi:hypothetical protein
MQKKALYMRLKGIPEGVIFLFFNIAKTLINKGSCVIPYFLSVLPAQAGIH